MGLLDDAIRDHLDLKRRHGADPAELERAEREALGPVRRKGDVAATGYADDVDVVEDEQFELDDDNAPAGSRPFAYDQAAEDDWDLTRSSIEAKRADEKRLYASVISSSFWAPQPGFTLGDAKVFKAGLMVGAVVTYQTLSAATKAKRPR